MKWKLLDKNIMRSKRQIKIIVDTNLWISFLIGRKLSCLLELLSHADFQLVVCDNLLDEIRDVFMRPKFAKYYTPSNLAMLLNFMKEESLFYNLGIIPSRCRDPKDDYLLELALCSEADYLITGDKDLLTIQKIGTCQIVTAMEFDMLATSMGHTSMLHEAESEYCDISLLIDKTPNI